MAAVFSLTYLLVLLELVSCSHFRGGIVQWRPLNNNPIYFNGQVEITLRIAWRRSFSSTFYCDQNTILSRSLLGGGDLSCRSGCSGSVGTLTYYCTDFSTSEDWSAGSRTYTYNAGSITNIEASFASCCWIYLNQGGSSWELRVKMNLSPRSDNGLINTSPISNMPPIVRVQQNCNGRISVPVSDADGDDVRCRWATSSEGECAGVCQTFPATLTDCSLIFTANSLSTGWYGVALQIEDFASSTSTTPLSSIPLQFLVNTFYSSASCASRPELVGVTPPDGSCYPVPSGSTWTARIVAQSGSSSISITEFTTASPAGLTKSSLQTGPGTNQWYIDVTWSPSSSQTGPNIFCYYAQDSVGLSSTQFCITLLGRVTPPQPVSMSPITEIMSSTREWTIMFDQPFRRPTTSKYIRIYEGNTERQAIDVTFTSLATYPSSNLGRSLIFHTSYNFIIGHSYNIRLDEGVAVDNTYCGLNSTAITSSSFWSFTVVVCFSGMARLISSGSYDFEGRVEVCVNGGWGTVCDDGWDATDARVFCRQLNFTTSGIIAYSNAQYGQGSGPILIDNLACSGTETSLQSCTYDSHTGECSHAEDAGVRCHSLPTSMTYGTAYSASVGLGDHAYYQISSWTSIGATFSISLSSGMLVLYASDISQSPSSGNGNYVWTVQTSDYTEIFLNPSSLGRALGSTVYVILQGQASNTNYIIQVNSGNTLSTALSLGTVTTSTLTSASILYYNIPHSLEGITLSLTVTSGTIVCYASATTTNPTTSNHIWTVQSSGNAYLYLDPTDIGQVSRYTRVFFSIRGLSSTNSFSLTTLAGQHSSELTAGSQINDHVRQGRALFYYVMHTPSSGLTVQIDTLVGSVKFYASQTYTRPNASSYTWTVNVSGYDDIFIDPSTIGLSPGSTLYFAVIGVTNSNNFTLSVFSGDKSISEKSIGEYSSDIISRGQFRYYSIPFLNGGVTISVEVFTGHVWCYASDTDRNPDSSNYIWQLFISEYGDSYIDPSSLERPAGTVLYVAIEGDGTINNFTLNSTAGDTSLTNISNGILDTIAIGVTKYYVVPFTSGGITVRLDVSIGYISCYASDTTRNPNQYDYIWLINTTGYADGFLDPAAFGRPGAKYIYIALVGGSITNTYVLNTTAGNFSSHDVSIGSPVSDTVTSGQFRYYIFPFPVEGITIRVEVFSGQVWCYGSDVERNPNSDNYIWRLSISGYDDTYIDTASLERTPGAFLYVAIEGVSLSNEFTLNSTVGDTSIANVESEAVIGGTILQRGIKFYSLPFYSNGTTLKLTVTIGTINCYASDRFRNPNQYEYDWTVEVRDYWEIYIDPLILSRPAESILYVSFLGLTVSNAYQVNISSGNTLTLESEPPFDLEVTSVSPTEVTLVWQTPSPNQMTPWGVVFNYKIVLFEYTFGLPNLTLYTSNESYTFPLEEFNNYSVKIAAENTVGIGEFSSVFNFSTPQAAPTGPPLNPNGVTLSTTLLTLSWSPPEPIHINGIIDHYVVNVLEVYSNQVFVLITKDTSIQVGPLHPFYLYECTVAAYTVGLGPFSSPVSVQAGETQPTSAPRNIRDIDKTSTSILLSWDPPPVEDQNGLIRSYSISVTQLSTGHQWYLTSNSSYTNVTIEGLEPYNSYAFQLAAYTIATGPYSDATLIDTLEDAPTEIPSNVSVSAVNATTIYLSWNDVISIRGVVREYVVRVVETDTGLTTENHSNLTFISIHVHPAYLYNCSVSAITVARGPFSEVVSILIPMAAPSGPPQELNALPLSSRSLNLFWNPPYYSERNGDIQFYTINVSVLESGETFEATTTTMTLVLTSLRPYYTYSYVVAASTVVGQGPISSAFTIRMPEDVPSAPTLPRIETIVGQASQLLITWQPPSMPNGMIIQYTAYCSVGDQALVTNNSHLSNGSGSGYEELNIISNATVVGSALSAVVDGLKPYTSYDCFVTAFTSVGEGEASYVVSGTTYESTPETSPVHIQPVVVDSTFILLQWSPPLIPNGRIVSYTISYNSTEKKDSLMVPDMSQYLITNLEPYTLYHFTIFASTAIGDGPSSPPIEVRTQTAVPSSAPQNVLAIVTGTKSARFNWQHPPEEDHIGPILYYNLRIVEEEFNQHEIVVNTTNTNYEIFTLEEYIRYLCQVSAATESGNGPYSSPLKFTTLQDVPTAAPQSFVGSVESATLVLLSWQPPSPYERNGLISHYLIQVYEVESGRFWSLPVFNNRTSAFMGSLHPYYHYKCSVAAFTIALGPYSNNITLLTDQQAPSSPPMNILPYMVSATSFSLMWESPAFEATNGVIQQYVVQVVELDTGRQVMVSTNTTEVTLDDLHPFYTYSSRIAAKTIAVGPFSTPLAIQLSEDVPTAPPSLTAYYVIDSTSLFFSWNAPPVDQQNGIIRHYILALTELDTGFMLNHSTAESNFTLTSLHPSYTYQVEVAAFTIDSGPFSASVTLQTFEDAPSSPPLSITVDEISSSNFYLSWNPPPKSEQHGEIIGYNVSVTNFNTGAQLTIFTPINNTEIASLRPFTTYLYAVAAITAAGIGPYSVSSMLITDEAAPDGAPESLNVTMITSTSISLQWSPPMEVLLNGIIREYLINITEYDTATFLVYYSTTTSLTVSSLHPYYTYLGQVSAFTVEYGPFTDVFQVTTLQDAPSGFPQDLSLSHLTSSGVELSWNQPILDERNGIITGYFLLLTNQKTGSEIHLNSTINFISISMLSPFTAYTVIIAAVTEIGAGPYSPQLGFNTDEDVPVSAPLNPNAIAIDSRTLHFSWNEPLQQHHNGIIREYHVNITELDTGRHFQVVSSATSVSVSSLHPFYNYEWTVSAFTVGEGPYSVPLPIATPEDVPSGAPLGFRITATEVDSVSLAWEPVLSEERNGLILGYTVILTSLFGTESRQIDTEFTNASVPLLAPYTTYECMVSAYTSVGTGPPSGILLVQTKERSPSGTPSNTSGIAINSTHIYISWDPVDEDQLHGELTGYTVLIIELETLTSFQVSLEPVTEAIIGPLHPHYTYNCTISAVTVGEGPPSTQITVRTDEDVPSGSPVNLTLTALSSTHIEFEWEPPEFIHRNGIIRQYIVMVSTQEDSMSITTSVMRASISALRPFTLYRVSVAAVTIGAGPESEAIAVETLSAAPEGPPQSVAGHAISPTTLMLSWDPPQREVINGIIQRYTVSIIEHETARNTTIVTNNTSLNVTSLHPYYVYSITIAAETIATGPFSPPIVIQMPESAPSSPPAEIYVDHVTSTSFTLFWNAPPPEGHNGLIRYYTVQCLAHDTEQTLQIISHSTETVVDSLHPFYRYTCSVSAVTVIGGPNSRNITILTLQDAPSAVPTELTTVATTPNAVNLSWAPPPPESHNGVINGYFINITNDNFEEIQLLFSTEEFITVESLQPYMTYFYSVAANTDAGLGPFSVAYPITTDEDVPVSPPTMLIVQASTSTSVTLTWSAPPEEHRNGVIRHYRISVNELDTEKDSTVTSLHTSSVISDLHPFYTYNFSVCAVTVGVGPCAYIGPIQLEQEIPSGSPENLTLLFPSATSIILQWEPPAINLQNGNITEYIINMTEVETGTLQQFKVASGAFQLQIDMLHPYYIYDFIIAAATVVGLGPFTSVTSGLTPEAAPSSPPTNASGEVLSSTIIFISWSPPVSEGQNGIIVSYCVKLLEVPTGMNYTYHRSSSHTEILITGLHPFYKYNCSVSAETSAGQGPSSVPFTIRTHEDAPNLPPQNIQSLEVNSTSIQLTWEPPLLSGQNGVIQYYIINITEQATMRQFNVESITNYFTLVDLHPYYLHIISVSAVTVGQGPFSDTVSIQTLEDAPSGPPLSFSVVAISPVSIRLTWASPLPEDLNGVLVSYRVIVMEAETKEVFQRTTAFDTNSLVVSSLHPYYNYNCSVAAFTVAFGPNAYAEVRTFPEAPSGTPQNATLTVLNPKSLLLMWLPPIAEDTNGLILGYIIQVTGLDDSTMTEQSTNETAIHVDDLHPFYSYSFGMSAYTEVGTGPKGLLHIQMPQAEPEGSVGNITTVIISPTSVVISWLPPNISLWNGIILKYTVEYQRQGPVEFIDDLLIPYFNQTISINSLENNPDPRLATSPLMNESVRIDGLEENFQYQFIIYYENSAGKSIKSDAIQLGMPSSTPSEPPTNVTAEAISTTELNISWQPPPRLEQNGIITTFEVLILCPDLNVNYTYHTTGNITVLTATDLKEDVVDCQVVIAASTTFGFGPYSDPVSVNDDPNKPQNLSVKVINSSAVSLSWSPPMSIKGVIIEYQINYSRYKPTELGGGLKSNAYTDGPYVILVNGTELSKVISNLNGGLVYEFKVRAKTNVGYGSYTDVVTMTLPLVTEPPKTNSTYDPLSGGDTAAIVTAIFAVLILVVVVFIIGGIKCIGSKKSHLTQDNDLTLNNMDQSLVAFNDNCHLEFESNDSDTLRKVDLSVSRNSSIEELEHCDTSFDLDWIIGNYTHFEDTEPKFDQDEDNVPDDQKSDRS